MKSYTLKTLYLLFLIANVFLIASVVNNDLYYVQASSVSEENAVSDTETVNDDEQNSTSSEESGNVESVETNAVPDETPSKTETTSESFQMDVKCTAYCSCAKCCGIYAKNRPVDEEGNPIILTASGEKAQAGVTVGVDPDVIPLGAKVVINGHEYIAQDTGNPNVVKDNVIDVYFDDHDEALEFGVQYATATIITT